MYIDFVIAKKWFFLISMRVNLFFFKMEFFWKSGKVRRTW